MKKKVSNVVYDVAFLWPAVAGFLLTTIVPFFMSIGYSLQEWNGISDDRIFVGFDNFIRAFSDPEFLESFWYTIQFTFFAVIFANIVAFALANLLTGKVFFRKGHRVIFFLPNVVSGLLLGYIWQFIFINGFPAIGELTGIPFSNSPGLAQPQPPFLVLS